MEKFNSKRNIDTVISRRNFLKKTALLVGGLAAGTELVVKGVHTIEKINEWSEIESSVEKLKQKFGLRENELAIIINPENQRLYLIKNNSVEKSYPISTSKYGLGSESGSNKTPMGTHRIVEKIGDGATIGEIFDKKIDTGEKTKIISEKEDIPVDLVTTRILSLNGLENNINKGRAVDSYARSIYIHGTPEEGLIGTPASHGCIRMKNKDIIELFNIIPNDTLVEIQNKNFKK